MMLTGDTLISFLMDPRTGSAVGGNFLSTKLQSAAFLKPENVSGIEEARLPVSGILIGGFGCKPPKVYGLLHPNPIRPFNRRLLGPIEFCQLVRDNENMTLSCKWV